VVQGSINQLELTWHLNLEPVNPPLGHPGDILVPQLILPLMASVEFYQKEIARLEDLLRKKDYDIREAGDLLELHRLPRLREPSHMRNLWKL
jgi:hypothetical protein